MVPAVGVEPEALLPVAASLHELFQHIGRPLEVRGA
jgi:hypothetical protein